MPPVVMVSPLVLASLIWPSSTVAVIPPSPPVAASSAVLILSLAVSAVSAAVRLTVMAVLPLSEVACRVSVPALPRVPLVPLKPLSPVLIESLIEVVTAAARAPPENEMSLAEVVPMAVASIAMEAVWKDLS
ncbi:hypothetical protein D3C87_1619470 [compost metagenome]